MARNSVWLHGEPGKVDLEAPFQLSELFFSRTDERGKIMAGNSVFQRISQYEWSELLHKPHNVIRHHHMPRGVFWLLWDRLRKGMVTGAYVKNRAKDGRYYWVYAIITPTDAGYLSVRVKPSSCVHSTIEAEYARLLEQEASHALSPAQSAEMLMSRLQELGFRDYSAFMSHALAAEISARNVALQRESDRLMGCFEVLMACAQSLISGATGISEGYRSYQFVPLNLLVQAGRLGHAGSAIGTISSNYSLLSDEIRTGLVSFVEVATRVSATICEGAFLLGTARLQQEVVALFEAEPQQPEIEHAREMALLTSQQQCYHENALEKLESIRGEVDRFHQQMMDLKRLASGLSAIRVMGKVESGRLSVGVLNDLIADLEAFQQLIAAGLTDIDSVNQSLRQNVALLMSIHRGSASTSEQGVVQMLREAKSLANETS